MSMIVPVEAAEGQHNHEVLAKLRSSDEEVAKEYVRFVQAEGETSPHSFAISR